LDGDEADNGNFHRPGDENFARLSLGFDPRSDVDADPCDVITSCPYAAEMSGAGSSPSRSAISDGIFRTRRLPQVRALHAPPGGR
jgi:hypothetical protein